MSGIEDCINEAIIAFARGNAKGFEEAIFGVFTIQHLMKYGFKKGDYAEFKNIQKEIWKTMQELTDDDPFLAFDQAVIRLVGKGRTNEALFAIKKGMDLEKKKKNYVLTSKQIENAKTQRQPPLIDQIIIEIVSSQKKSKLTFTETINLIKRKGRSLNIDVDIDEKENEISCSKTVNGKLITEDWSLTGISDRMSRCRKKTPNSKN